MIALILTAPAFATETAGEKAARLKADSGAAAAMGDPLAVLNAEDVLRYKRIFMLQDSGKIDAADTLIRALDDPILMGHVLFQRYMHPTAYRSSFGELNAWLTQYADHPDAVRIYRLATRRKPQSAPAPRTAERKRWRYANARTTAFEVHNPPRTSAQSRTVRRIERRVRSLLRRERPTQALGYLGDMRKHLTTVEYDNIRQWIATSYYAEQVDDKALALAREVAKKSGEAVPMSHWIAGLAAWRQGDPGLAATHFEALARAEHVDEDDRAAGAFWAARGFLKTRQSQKIVPMLRIAAAQDRTFYGILAARQLGHRPDASWPRPALDGARAAALVREGHVRRAAALVQVGQIDLAEEELAFAHGKLKDADDPALLAVAGHLNIPSIEMKVAISSKAKGLEAGLYPTPDYQPQGGYAVDRALLFAIIRKESKFLASALSRAGARGLMQIMPMTAYHITRDRGFRGDKRDELHMPEVNIALGQTYIQELMGAVEPDGNLLMMLAAYNAGPGNLRRWVGSIKFKDDPLLFLESLPVRETRTYVEKVMANLWLYRARFGQDSPSLDAMARGAWPIYEPQEAFGTNERVAALGFQP